MYKVILYCTTYVVCMRGCMYIDKGLDHSVELGIASCLGRLSPLQHLRPPAESPVPLAACVQVCGFVFGEWYVHFINSSTTTADRVAHMHTGTQGCASGSVDFVFATALVFLPLRHLPPPPPLLPSILHTTIGGLHCAFAAAANIGS